MRGGIDEDVESCFPDRRAHRGRDTYRRRDTDAGSRRPLDKAESARHGRRHASDGTTRARSPPGVLATEGAEGSPPAIRMTPARRIVPRPAPASPAEPRKLGHPDL